MLYEYIRNKINLPFVDGTIRELQKQAKSIYKVRDNPVELASDSMIWALVALLRIQFLQIEEKKS